MLDILLGKRDDEMPTEKRDSTPFLYTDLADLPES